MNSLTGPYRIRIYLVIATIGLATGIALVFGFLYRPENENLSRAGSFAAVIGTTLGVLVAAYAIFLEHQRAEMRHEEANAAWAAALRLRYAMTSVIWMLPEAGQNAWIVANACRPRSPNTARVVRDFGSAGLPGSAGDSYLAGLVELHEAISAAITTGVGRVLGVAWNSEMWSSPNSPNADEDDARGRLAAQPLLELQSAIKDLAEQRRLGLMALPDVFTMVQMQAIFRALGSHENEDSGSKGTVRHKTSVPNLTIMHEFRKAYEDDQFDELAEDAFLGYYLAEYGAWMGSLLPYVGLAHPTPAKTPGAGPDWVPLGESDRFSPHTVRPIISLFFTWRPEHSFAATSGNPLAEKDAANPTQALIPDTWDSSMLAVKLQEASNAGNAEASNALGVLYACVKPRNYGFRPLELAVEQGSTNAKANLGIIHYEDASDLQRKDGPDSQETLEAWQRAADWFLEVIDLEPNHPQASFFGGLLAFQANKPDNAEMHFMQAFNDGSFVASGALIALAASRGDEIQALKWRDEQFKRLDEYRADDPLEVLAALNGYTVDLERALQ